MILWKSFCKVPSVCCVLATSVVQFIFGSSNLLSQLPSTTVIPSSQSLFIIMCMSVCKNTGLTCRFHSTQASQLCVVTVRSSGTAEEGLQYAGIPLDVMCRTDECFVVSRCSHHPQVLLVCHSDGGREPPLSETLLFCSVGALRSLPR